MSEVSLLSIHYLSWKQDQYMAEGQEREYQKRPGARNQCSHVQPVGLIYSTCHIYEASDDSLLDIVLL